MTETATKARLKTRYLEEIRPELIEQFGYSSVMQAPKLEKITLNMGVGQAKQDSKMLKAAQDQLATIAGQQPNVRRARKSIAAFKLREGMPVGLSVTLRSERGYEFLDRLVSIAIPRIRDFRGLNPRSFDGRGNYTLGVKEQIIFPEIDYDAIDQVRGLDITITTSAKTDVEAFALLMAFGMPFSTKWRPKGFDEAIGVESEPTDEDGARVSTPAATEQAADEGEPTDESEDDAATEAEQDAAESAPSPAAQAAESPAAEAEAEQAAEVEQPAAETEAEQPAEAEEASNETEVAKAQDAEASVTEQQDAPNPNPAPADADTTEKESTD
jgi:large subunit ribosomal protein L5